MNKKAAVIRRRRGKVEQKSLRKFQRKVECANRRPTCFGFIEVFDSKRMLNTLKKELRQPWNALMLQVSLSLRDK